MEQRTYAATYPIIVSIIGLTFVALAATVSSTVAAAMSTTVAAAMSTTVATAMSTTVATAMSTGTMTTIFSCRGIKSAWQSDQCRCDHCWKN